MRMCEIMVRERHQREVVKAARVGGQPAGKLESVQQEIVDVADQMLAKAFDGQKRILPKPAALATQGVRKRAHAVAPVRAAVRRMARGAVVQRRRRYRAFIEVESVHAALSEQIGHESPVPPNPFRRARQHV